MQRCNMCGVASYGYDVLAGGAYWCSRCIAKEFDSLRTQLAAAEAELDALRSRVICELADDDNEAAHECGWQVCGVCWNDACAAHKKQVDLLNAEIARLRKLCEPVAQSPEEQAFYDEHDKGQ